MEKEKNFYDILKNRGFIEQVTDEKEIKKLFEKQKITFYIGFDPTAPSLHIGHLLSLMVMAWAQKFGHQPIFLAGGGTGLIGDPSGKDKARPLMNYQTIKKNISLIKKQVSRFLNFKGKKGLLLNNAYWLSKLNYIEFLRDFGVHFRVNRMLTHEGIKSRLEKGLSFLEFNYQLLQAYDFWYQFKHYHCLMQMGGSDQWGNIVAGIELIKKLENKNTYGITFPLITTAEGKKMGKTEKGAVWLDKNLTSPFDYYQYWINTDDRDVKRFLLLFTFLPIEEVNQLASLSGSEIKKAKEVLAFETTKMVHGLKSAIAVQKSSKKLFNKQEDKIENFSVPTFFLSWQEIKNGILLSKLFFLVGLVKSVSEGKRLIAQGGGYLNKKRINDPNFIVQEKDFQNSEALLRAGKKKYFLVKIKKKNR